MDKIRLHLLLDYNFLAYKKQVKGISKVNFLSKSLKIIVSFDAFYKYSHEIVQIH